MCAAGDATGTGVYVSFVMVGRVDTLRGDYVGRLRNSVQFIQALSKVHNVRSEVCAHTCKREREKKKQKKKLERERARISGSNRAEGEG